jgi:hypothetical protein
MRELMTKKLTLEEFKEKSVAVHGEVYDYSNVVYHNNAVKVEIFCLRHNKFFSQSPKKHLAGQGCPICRYEKSSSKLTKTTEKFIEGAVEVHGDKYTYDKVVYTGSHTCVEIFCNSHGEYFKQVPTDHLCGKGCPKCGLEKVKEYVNSLTSNTQEFVEKARKVHGDLYSYHAVDYKRSSEKVKIWCNRHGGYFEQTPNSHLAGIGCASCAKTGYSTEKPGKLYVLRCDNITKVGITNFLPEDRAKAVSKSSKLKFSVVKVYSFADGAEADKVETNVLRTLRQIYNRPSKRFEGSSECFIDVSYEHLLSIIDRELENLMEKEDG